MNGIYIIFLFYIITTIIVFICYKFFQKSITVNEDAQKRLNNNITHSTELSDKFKEVINDRLQLLEKMSYDDWLNYNNKNVTFEFNDISYYLFIYEKANIDDNFILRASVQQELVNLNYSVERQIITHSYLILEEFPPSEFLPNEMYNMTLNPDGFNQISYFWDIPSLQLPAKKISTFTTFKKGDFTGVIGSGDVISYLNIDYGLRYSEIISIGMYIFFNLFFLFITIIIFKIDNKKIYKPLSIFSILNLCLLFLMSLKTTHTTVELEQLKIDQLSSSVLGLSFLVGVSIFIIGHTKNKELKTENSFLFSMSIVLLLLTIFKTNNYTSIDEIRSTRIKMQLFFNFTIVLSIFIILNYSSANLDLRNNFLFQK
jgi:hypothetical protein